MDNEDKEELRSSKFVLCSGQVLLYLTPSALQKGTNLDRLVFLLQKTIISFKMASVFCFIIPINSSVNKFVNIAYGYCSFVNVY